MHLGLDFPPFLFCSFKLPSWILVAISPLGAAKDRGSIPGLGRSPGKVNGNPLQYPCLENPMNSGAWWATVHGVAKSGTRLSDFTFTFTLPERSSGFPHFLQFKSEFGNKEFMI